MGLKRTELLCLVFLTSTLSSLSFHSPVFSQQNDSHKIMPSFGTVNYTTPMPLDVYYGFTIHRPSEGYTSEMFRKVKQDWGFNYVMLATWWYKIEPDRSKDGDYSETHLQRLRTTVNNAKAAGLEVFIDMRVDYGPDTSWDGPYTHDYVNMEDEGRQRYARLWEMLVQRFPDCMYVVWHMPYHKTYCSSTAREIYITTTFPTLLGAIRKYSSNKVVFVPIHQNPEYYPSSRFNDENVIYGAGHIVDGPVSWGKEPWDYDTTWIDTKIGYIRQWRQKYPDIPIASVEFGGIGFYSLPIDQSRLDCLEYACQEMKKCNAGWSYWCLSIHQSGDTILKDINNFIPEEHLLSILQENRAE